MRALALTPIVLFAVLIALPCPRPAWATEPAPAPLSERACSARARRSWAIATGAVAAAALIAGGVLGGVALSRSHEQDGNPSAPPLYDADLRARGWQGESMANAAYGLLGVGGVLATVDVIKWVELWKTARSP